MKRSNEKAVGYVSMGVDQATDSYTTTGQWKLGIPFEIS